MITTHRFWEVLSEVIVHTLMMYLKFDKIACLKCTLVLAPVVSEVCIDRLLNYQFGTKNNLVMLYVKH